MQGKPFGPNGIARLSTAYEGAESPGAYRRCRSDLGDSRKRIIELWQKKHPPTRPTFQARPSKLAGDVPRPDIAALASHQLRNGSLGARVWLGEKQISL